MDEPDHSAGLASAFTDLMTSLAVIFILLLVASLNNAFQKGQNTRQNILDKLQKELQEFTSQERDKIEVKIDERDPLALLILVPEGLLEFPTNKAEIPTRGKAFMTQFIPKLSKVVYSDEFKEEIGSIVVEGHADPRGDDNWNLKLSQDRSMAVVGKCLEIFDSDNMIAEKDYFLNKLSATGRGNKEPIYVNGALDNDKSRRVVFKIRIQDQKLESLAVAAK
jgi:outer membrane protein OmpA-like peptidoglycan-associated protein